ncbi:MAG TPA: ATP-grasp domain-containing protein [Dehalococcoidales bacterium]
MKVAIIYNEPGSGRYQAMGEAKAELGVMDEVRAVSQALVELNYSSVLVPLSPPLDSVHKTLAALEADIIFNLFEGFDGSPETEGQVAAMLEARNKPFTGCPAPALTLGLDKYRTKQLLESAGIQTPKYQILAAEGITNFHLNFPCIVKPLAEDASHGISEDSVVNEPAALTRQLRKICALFGGRALVEEFIDGREFNTTVMGTPASGGLTIPAISEIVYTLPPDKPRVLTFDAKWEEDSLYFINTKTVCPATITQEEEKEISRIAKDAFRLTGCRGYARADFRQDKNGQFVVLEVNPNPDITPGSGAALQAATSGLSYSQFVEKIIRFALE